MTVFVQVPYDAVAGDEIRGFTVFSVHDNVVVLQDPTTNELCIANRESEAEVGHDGDTQ